MKYNWNLSNIQEAVSKADSYSETLRIMNIPTSGRNTDTLKRKIEEYNINIDHFTFSKQYKNGSENLIMLCPNCHSQTENFCGNSNKNPIKYYCKDCGAEISRGSTYCPKCAHIHAQKIERPSKEQLLNDFKELKSFTQVGNKYNVTDNAVRKWYTSYGIPNKSKELKEYINSL